jgi:ribosomal protein S3AE
MAEKKKFHLVEIPILKREIELFGFSDKEFEGRFVKIDLSPELKGKGVELKMKIVMKDSKPIAETKEAYLLGSFIRRMMRKGTDYVEDSFIVKSKDELLRIKPFLITRKKVSRKVRASLRNAARKEITDYAAGKKFEEIVIDMINNRIQKELSLKLKKIYPLALCEIRHILITTQKEYNRQLEIENATSAREEKRNLKNKKEK